MAVHEISRIAGVAETSLYLPHSMASWPWSNRPCPGLLPYCLPHTVAVLAVRASVRLALVREEAVENLADCRAPLGWDRAAVAMFSSLIADSLLGVSLETANPVVAHAVAEPLILPPQHLVGCPGRAARRLRRIVQ